MVAVLSRNHCDVWTVSLFLFSREAHRHPHLACSPGIKPATPSPVLRKEGHDPTNSVHTPPCLILAGPSSNPGTVLIT